MPEYPLAGRTESAYVADSPAVTVLLVLPPAFALIADGADRSGLAQGMAFGMMNAAWAIGAIVGPAGAGALATATGEAVPYLLAAIACLATVAMMLRRPRPQLVTTASEG